MSDTPSEGEFLKKAGGILLSLPSSTMFPASSGTTPARPANHEMVCFLYGERLAVHYGIDHLTSARIKQALQCHAGYPHLHRGPCVIVPLEVTQLQCFQVVECDLNEDKLGERDPARLEQIKSRELPTVTWFLPTSHCFPFERCIDLL